MGLDWDRSATATVTSGLGTGRGLVCSVDRLASECGASILAAGGTAADAAIATSAALAVTTPHMCGMGGDLFALVHTATGAPAALNASGRAGSGADPDRLRAEGHTEMPYLGDVRSCPVPGCVDGWLALHERFGRLPLAEVLAPAVRLAEAGFPAAPLLASALPLLDGVVGCDELTMIRPRTGDLVLRPGVARALEAVAAGGRADFYGGEFGERLIEAGRGEYTADDLVTPLADWVEPLGRRLWDHDVWTIPPNSQGYLSLLGAAIAEAIGVPDDPADPAWAHVLVEAARLAGSDRDEVLHEGADGEALLSAGRIAERVARFHPDRSVALGDRYAGGGTIHLCTADGEGNGVSLIQSNAAGFGAHVAVPGTGILLHNRGIGFSLRPGHPAEYGPGRRPPHTLSPALVTRADGTLRSVLGTMGGDSQPQVVLQMLARLLRHGQVPGEVIAAPRFVLTTPGNRGFDTWTRPDEHVVRVESHAPPAWDDGLTARGHRVARAKPDVVGFGHAHLIDVEPTAGTLGGAADPRAMSGAAIAAEARPAR
jgi:gamma-glutamyltranspeptidase/glutathione hydrolase